MGRVVVDQIGPRGELLADVDTTLTERQKNDLLLAALPGAAAEVFAGTRVVRYRENIIMRAQVTYLGTPWEAFKKRIQIPNKWVAVHARALDAGLVPHFVGIYHYRGVSIFVDFDPSKYVLRKANNSAAHVSTNDLFQAQTLGVFSREDNGGNRLTSVRADELASYLEGRTEERHPRVEVFDRFNLEILGPERTEALTAVQEMHQDHWPDTFQAEWPGFYLEYRLAKFIREHRLGDLVEYQKAKKRGAFDYDLVFTDGDRIDYYGDLKASNSTASVSPGNDAENIRRCIEQYGRFWYVIYEHETWHDRANEDHRATIEWNEWKRSVGFDNGKPFDPLSYWKRFKSAVRYHRMMILEVNTANFGLVLSDFNQGKQPDGAARAVKVMIAKKNIDNFLIFSAAFD